MTVEGPLAAAMTTWGWLVRTDATYMSIGELADVMGVSVAAVRSWEKRYGWPCPERTEGSHRRYRRSELPMYRVVAGLRREMATPEALARLRGAQNASPGPPVVDVPAK